MYRVFVLVLGCMTLLGQQTPLSPRVGGPGERTGVGRQGMRSMDPARRPKQAPQPENAGPPGSVRGQVVSAAGEPLRKAEVVLRSLSGRSGVYSMTTDASGVFNLEGVAPGNYAVSAQRTGYVRQDAGARTTGRAATPPIVVGPGQAVTGVTITLVPHGVITGRVVDEDGEPMERVTIQVQRERWHRGRRQLLQVMQSFTNDLGEYRVAGLSAGRYYLSASAMRMGRPDASRMRPAGNVPETGYTTVFYPNVSDPVQAAPVQVGSGQEARGMDFQLRKAATFRIRGRVADAGAGAVNNTTIMVVPGDAASGISMRMGASVRNPDGSFEVAGVPAGSYTLVANRMDRERGRTSATQQVQVGNRDIDGVVLTMMPLAQVTGVVRADADAQIDLSRVRIALENASGAMFPGGASQAAVSAGQFQMPGIVPGDYRLSAFGLPEGTYLKSARQGPREILDSGLTISGTSAPIEVIIGVNAPAVTGTVQDSNGKPAAGVVAVLVPDAPRRDQYRLYLISNTTDGGAFTFRNITPGNYKVFLFPESDAEAIQNPAFLAQNESRGTSVQLGEGKAESLQLRFAQ
jgi:protocatechuate 3,4-dioxygenase beta subunit